MNRPAHIPDMVEIDAVAIRTYCQTVFGYLDGLVPVRYLAEKGTPSQAPAQAFVEPGALAEQLIAAAKKAADTSRAVFVVPATVRKAGSARADDIHQTGVVLVDLDSGDIAAARAQLTRHLGRPTLEIASGGVTVEGQQKLHLYWRLTEAAKDDDLRRVAEIRGALADKAGGDPSFRSLHQPVRVAGTIHGKHEQKAPVRLIANNAIEYDLDELSEAIANMPHLAGPADLPVAVSTISTGPSPLDLSTKRVREGGIDGITRFAAVSKVIGHWIRNVRRGTCSAEDAWQAVLEYNAAMIVPPWEERCLQDEFRRLWHVDIRNHGPMPAVAADRGLGNDGAAPKLSDDALASAFVAEHGSAWRYVPPWKSWFRWDGRVWLRDETHLVREHMRLACRAAAADAKATDARRVTSEKTIAAALRLTATDPLIALPTSAWDAEPMLLNTPGGVLDLATGEVLSHDPGRLMTQMTTAALGSGCPRWLAFLDEVLGGDTELQAYLRRLAGYCLTGMTSEQIFVFLHGQGANGKSVFLSTLSHVLGSYAATATLETFTASRTSRHLTELAGLRGARLVQVPETESGQAWAEARIKSVTGGEKIRANFMYQDHFEFLPRFKLIVAGNHRPALTNVGEAMRRRLHLVPFIVTIPPEKRDPHLADALRAEADGILGWMVEGCMEWQQSGLAPPPPVLNAAEDYFAAEDLIGQWIAECCVVDPNVKARSATLFESWKGWAESNGFPWGTTKSLGEALRARGFTDGRVEGARGWNGIAVARRAALGEGA